MGEYITLEQILEFREKKAQMQDTLRLRHSGTITVALGMNIPGPKKTDSEIVKAFREGCRSLEQLWSVSGLRIVKKVVLEETAGNVVWFCILDESEDLLLRVKKWTIELEQNHPLGRLFDIDVYDRNGMACSRRQLGIPERRCLLCGGSAKACGRSRAHRVEELQKKVYEMIRSWEKEEAAKRIGRKAKEALVEEAVTTPKPGLVDAFSNGAHEDMNLESFLQSAAVLEPYFVRMAQLGIRYSKQPQRVFHMIRQVGMEAEVAMYAVTDGANTHKGAIFTMGILSAAAGACVERYGCVTLDTWIAIEQEMVRDILIQELEQLQQSECQLTHGEQNLFRYGSLGVRGEAALGYPSVTEVALGVLRDGKRQGHDWNRVKLQTLFTLIGQVEDGNVLSRVGTDGLQEIRRITECFMRAGGAYQEDAIQQLEEMDRFFTEKRYSNGGCADLLAAAIFVDEICETRTEEG